MWYVLTHTKKNKYKINKIPFESEIWDIFSADSQIHISLQNII